MAATDRPVVKLTGIGKRYRGGKEFITVLDGLDLEVRKGDFIALMGPSGSGKTTLLNIIGGLDEPNSGHVEVTGLDLAALSKRRLAKWRSRHIGFVFQSYNLIGNMTATRNVELPLLLKPLSRKRRREQIQTAFSLVNLSHKMKSTPRQLSGGEEQRVAIARAIVSDPTLLLCDEPTGNLDRKASEEVMELLQALNSEHGNTILLVTHSERAASYARQRLFLYDGHLHSTPDTLGEPAR